MLNFHSLNYIVVAMINVGAFGMACCGAAVAPVSQPQLSIPRNWRWAITPSDWQAINRADTAQACLTLADHEIRLGYWRLHHLNTLYLKSGGKIDSMRPPATENWGIAIEAFRRGTKIVKQAASSGSPVSSPIVAKLISRRAMFLFQRSSKTAADAQKALSPLMRAERLASPTPEILCDLARLYGDTAIVLRPGEPTEKARIALKMSLRYAHEAIALNPQCAAAYLQIAGAINGLKGIRATSSQVEADVKALELWRFINPAIYAWDYHYINWMIQFPMLAIKAWAPTAYRQVYPKIVHFSGKGKVLPGIDQTWNTARK